MERFVQCIVGGGTILVAGLWIMTVFESVSGLWLFGAILVLLGSCGLGFGIWSELSI